MGGAAVAELPPRVGIWGNSFLSPEPSEPMLKARTWTLVEVTAGSFPFLEIPFSCSSKGDLGRYVGT